MIELVLDDTQENADWIKHVGTLSRLSAGRVIAPRAVSERTVDLGDGPWRPLTLAEEQAQILTAGGQAEDATEALAGQLGRKLAPFFTRFRGRVATAYRDRAVEISAPAGLLGDLRTLIAEALLARYHAAEQQAHAALPEVALVQRASPALVGAKARAFFRQKAFFITDVFEAEMLAAAQQVLLAGLRTQQAPRDLLFRLDQVLAEWIPIVDSLGRVVNLPHRLETIARTNIMEATNEGRWALFTDPDLEGAIVGLRYAAVMDNRTRRNHAAWDGVTLPASDPVWAGAAIGALPAVSSRRPINGFNCRCMFVPVFDAALLTAHEALPSVEVRDPGFN